MKIAIVGTGAIGSTFAHRLAESGHEITVVARGKRLEELEYEKAIVLQDGARASVEVHGSLPTSIAYDLVLVTVLAPQVDAVLPSLVASAAKAVMFMFNTFEPLDRLRDAVGPERFVFGFPGGIFAVLRDGRISPQIRSGTTVGEARWARTFTEAGIPSEVEGDMHAWLRSHAALVVPLMAIGVLVRARGAGVSWTEARRYSAAFVAGFALVRELGHTIVPKAIGTASRLPRAVITSLLWLMSRTKMLRDLGELGTAEARMLVDMMSAAAPGGAPELVAIRP